MDEVVVVAGVVGDINVQREISLVKNGGGLDDLVVFDDTTKDVIRDMLNDLKGSVVTNQVSTTVHYEGHRIYKSTLVSHLYVDISYPKIDCCVQYFKMYCNNNDDYFFVASSKSICLLHLRLDCVVFFCV